MSEGTFIKDNFVTLTGNVGIGSTNPNSKLSIVGDTARICIFDAGLTNGLITGLLGGGEGYIQLNNSSGTGKVLLRGDAGTNYIAGGGDVGIGTTNPYYKLDVTGDARFTGITYLDAGSHIKANAEGAFMVKRYTTSAAGDDVTSIWQDDGGINFLIDNDNDGDTGAFKVMYKTGGSNASIYTATCNLFTIPCNSFVDGVSYIGDTTRYLRTGNNGGIRIQTAGGFLDLGPQNTAYSHIETDRACFYFNKGVAVNTGLIGSYDEDLTLRAAFTNSTSHIRMCAGGSEKVTILSGGNVGIGSASPARRLDVSNIGQITFGDLVSGTPSVTPGIFWHSGDNYAIFRSSGSWTSPNYQQLKIRWATGIILDPGNSTFAKSHVGVCGGVSVGNSYYTVKQDNGLLVQGSVGIGTTNPTNKIHVCGAGVFTSESNFGSDNQTGSILLCGAGTGLYSTTCIGSHNFARNLISHNAASEVCVGHQSIYQNGLLLHAGQSSDTKIRFCNQGGERMRITHGGNVGIGTTDPQYKLDVTGSIRATTNMYLGDNMFHDGDTNTWIGFCSADAARIVTGGAERMSVKNTAITFNEFGHSVDFRVESDNNDAMLMVDGSADKVGIGTLTPSAVLDVSGTDTVFSVQGTNGTLFSVQDDLSDSLMSVNDAAGLPVLEVFADNSICAGRYTCSDFYIASGGNVGIHTNSPDANHDLTIANNANYGIRFTNTNSTIEANSNLILKSANNIYIRPGSAYCTFMDTGRGMQINSNWGLGGNCEQFTIYGTYPSLALRSTTAGNTNLMHSDCLGNLNFYNTLTTCGVASQAWGKRACITTDGRLWAQDYIQVSCSGCLRNVSGTYGSIEIDGGACGGYEGYSIGGRAVFMHNNGSVTGIYNDDNNQWLFLGIHGGESRMYHNGGTKICTRSDGGCVFGTLCSSAVSIEDKLVHTGDTNTYFNFCGEDAARIVTGGVERHAWRSTNTVINEGGHDYDFRVEAQSTSSGPLSNKAYALFVDASAAAVGIGTSQPSYALEVGGTAHVAGVFTATTKNFLIDHPTKKNHMLRYGSLEGPENGVYVRGTTTINTIELPDYWTGLVDEDTITVTLTPRGKYLQLFIEKVEDNKVYVGGTEIGELYDYTVYGTRKDVDELVVEFERPTGK